MTASVTLKLTPTEFDLIRAALETHRSAMIYRGEAGGDPKERQEAKATALLTGDLLKKLA